MKTRVFWLMPLLILVLFGSAQAELHVRGTGTITGGGSGDYSLIYDDLLDITWLDCTTLGSWSTTVQWAEDLEVFFNGETYDNWRLPYTLPVNGTIWGYTFSNSVNGSTDYGYNISAPGSAYPGSKGSEMAHLYYTTLGNLGCFDINGTIQFGLYGLKNKGPFNSLMTDAPYWSRTVNYPGCVPSGEDWVDCLSAFYFFFENGQQSWNYFELSSNDVELRAVAVLDGDVSPNITVTDSKGTADDLEVPFGNVEAGQTADAIVTIANNGTSNLILGAITDPSAPFTVDASSCSEQTLAPGENCVCNVTFAPTTAGNFTDSFTIPSNDPDENPEIIALTGAGTDSNDNCPDDPDKTEPGICGCGTPDTDSDQDGTPDCNDNCPDDSNKTEPGICGCGTPDTDSDQDGTPDCNDNCPDDSNKTEPGICGCGTPDTDSDQDGTPDCNDNCPDDPDKTEPGICGCGTPDTDSDQDGTPDCNDNCPDDSNKTEPGICGCGTPDTDSDQDGTPDCNDNCPDDSNKTEPGICGCGTPDTDSDQDGTPDCIDTDDDGDGMPDTWEDKYGLNPLVDDANEDPDEDGFTNVIEYKRGTDPQDPSSHPTMAMPWLPLLLGDEEPIINN